MAWIDKKPSGTYLVRWREPSGKTVSKATRTKDEARALKAQVESQILTGSYIAQEARRRPFLGYAREVLDNERNLEASTRYQSESILRRWVEGTALAATPIGEVDAGTIRRFFGEIERGGASASTVGRVRNLVGKIMRRALQEGAIARNPVAVVPAPKSERRHIRILTPEEVAWISENHQVPYGLIPLLSAWGTFRIGEIGALHVDDIQGDTIRVRRSVAVAGSTYYLKGPKTAAGRRTVQLPTWVMDRVREHVLSEELVDGFLFRSPQGQLMNHVHYHRIWQSALKAANFPKPWPVPHDLRHTAVALMIKAGAHPKQIQARCGHATIKETMDTYGHLFPGHDDELVRALEAFRPSEGGEVIPFGRPGAEA